MNRLGKFCWSLALLAGLSVTAMAAERPGHAPVPVGYAYQQVVVAEGYYIERQVPAVIAFHYDSWGRRYQVIVQPARCERVWVPARTEWRLVALCPPPPPYCPPTRQVSYHGDRDDRDRHDRDRNDRDRFDRDRGGSHFSVSIGSSPWWSDRERGTGRGR